MRFRGGEIAVLLCGLAVGLAAVEVGLRASGAQREFLIPDAVIGYRLTPHFSRVVTQFEASGSSVELRTDALGLRRDGATQRQKPPGVKRILVLGDSQTEGLVDNAQTYPALLEAKLAGAGAGKVEILNAGVSGYSPLLEYLWLREYGAALQPDVVVLALYTGNDLGELTTRIATFGGSGPSVPIATIERVDSTWEIRRPGLPDRLAAADFWLQAQLRSYALLRRHLGAPRLPAVPELGRASERCPGCLQALWQQWVSQTQADAYAQTPTALREILSRFAALAKEIGARPLVVLLPTKLEVEGDLVLDDVRNTQAILDLRTPATSFAQVVRTAMLAACASKQLEVIDLLPILRSARSESRRSFYWSSDWHLNPDGHEAVAAALQPRLADLVGRR